MLIGLKFTLSAGATVAMAANWLVPEPCEASPKDPRPGHTGHRLFKQFEPFGGHAVFGTHKTGDVAAGPRQAINEASANWIAEHRRHNRHRPS
jgi:hypothetical protein